MQLTEIQRQRFKELSGFDFNFSEKSGEFSTPYPYNNREWEYSPWFFRFIIEQETNYLICELSHRMTNNRIHGWDKDGNELSTEILYKYFKPDY